MGNPLPSEAFTRIVGQLLDAGLAEADVTAMVRQNPARLLDLAD
jgi:predicted metal-dependent phosphotriesterase family hydrolase